MIDYQFKWDSSFSEIQKQIETELRKEILEKLGIDIQFMTSSLKDGVRKIVRKHIETNRTFISLCKDSRGELWAELGLPMKNRAWAANEMIDIIAEGVEVYFQINGNSGVYDIGIFIEWSNEKAKELMSRPESSYVSINKKRGSFTIPWLEWLLEGGARVLVTGFHIEYGDFVASRSKMALMKPNGSWSLPPEHGNFITDSLIEAYPEIIKYVMENQ